MDEVFDRFIKEHFPRLRKYTQQNYLKNIETLRSFFGRKNVKEISRTELLEWMKVETGKYNRNRLLAVLSTAMTDAVKWGWIDANVCKEVDRHKAKKRDRIVSAKELEGIKKRADRRMAVAIDLSVLTGLSQSEVLSLTWDQIDEEDNVLRYKHSRTGQPVRVPITSELRQVLARAKQLPMKGSQRPSSKRTNLVLPTSYGNKYSGAGFRASWQRLIDKWEKAGNGRFTFNDLQKTWTHNNKKTGSAAAAVTSVEDDVALDFPQFDAAVREEATKAALHYKVFYCLEQSIRKLIITTMEDAYGVDWWNTSGKVNPQIKQEVDNLVAREIDTGMTQRSERMIDYTTFGQLGQIIVQNWDGVFDKKMKSNKAVNHVMASLNRIRGPIAHCSPMSEHEVRRLEVQVTDWFNLLLPNP